MADHRSARLALPFIESGQAQKEVAHNEALALLDIAVQAGVQAAGVDQPPADPEAGACWIVGPAPVGAWEGQAGCIAGWTGGGWRFVVPREGTQAWNRAARHWLTRVDGIWEEGVVRGSRLVLGGEQVVGARRPAIAAPSGGAAIDAEARVAIGAILDAMRAHGLIAS